MRGRASVAVVLDAARETPKNEGDCPATIPSTSAYAGTALNETPRILTQARTMVRAKATK
jgi:hypothetical protein